VKRDKKKFGFLDFCAQLPAFLIENLTQMGVEKLLKSEKKC
jgi:hypothetical protein